VRNEVFDYKKMIKLEATNFDGYYIQAFQYGDEKIYFGHVYEGATTRMITYSRDFKRVEMKLRLFLQRGKK
jgi:hypothetical protein